MNVLLSVAKILTHSGDSKMTDKHAILNVTKIIDMIEDARYAMYSDTEQTSFILNELVDILQKADSLELQLGQVQQ